MLKKFHKNVKNIFINFQQKFKIFQNVKKNLKNERR